MKHCHPRRDAALEHRIDQAIIKINATCVHRAEPVRHDAGPGDRQPVIFDAEPGHQIEIFAVTMVVIAGDVEIVAVMRRAGLAGERVPHGRALAVLGGSALDLGRGRGDAPGEIARENRGSARR